jgi:hypothetical protein
VTSLFAGLELQMIAVTHGFEPTRFRQISIEWNLKEIWLYRTDNTKTAVIENS